MSISENIKLEIESHKTAWGSGNCQHYILTETIKNKIIREIEFLEDQLEGAKSFRNILKTRVIALQQVSPHFKHG